MSFDFLSRESSPLKLNPALYDVTRQISGEDLLARLCEFPSLIRKKEYELVKAEKWADLDRRLRIMLRLSPNRTTLISGIKTCLPEFHGTNLAVLLHHISGSSGVLEDAELIPSIITEAVYLSDQGTQAFCVMTAEVGEFQRPDTLLCRMWHSLVGLNAVVSIGFTDKGMKVLFREGANIFMCHSDDMVAILMEIARVCQQDTDIPFLLQDSVSYFTNGVTSLELRGFSVTQGKTGDQIEQLYEDIDEKECLDLTNKYFP